MSVTVTCLLLLFSTLISNGKELPAIPTNNGNTVAATGSGATGNQPANADKNRTANASATSTVANNTMNANQTNATNHEETNNPVSNEGENRAAAASATGSVGSGAVNENKIDANVNENKTSHEDTSDPVPHEGANRTQAGSVKDNAENKNTTVAPSSEEIGSPEVGEDTNIEYIDSDDETDSYDEAFDEDDDAAASYASDDELDGIDVEDDDLAAEMDVDEDEEPGDKLNDGGGGDDETTDLDAGHGAVTVDVPKSTQFLPYFIAAVVAFVFLYLAYHQRNKIMAFVIEGKRSLAKRKREPRPKAGEYTRITTSAEDVDTRTKGFTF